MNLADKNNYFLEGFNWKGALRPKSKEDLFSETPEK
jgi:hypothetical protein